MSRVIQRHWPGNPDALSRRGQLPCDYEANVPDPLVGRPVTLDGDVAADVADAQAALTRLDAQASSLADTEGLARLLLRAESVASSRIEGLEVGARKLLRTEAARQLGERTIDLTAAEVLGNINAMNIAVREIGPGDRITTDILLGFHSRLMANSRLAAHAGRLREQQNWIGGSDYNPCSAAFVPPPPELVPGLLDDLCAFCNDDSLPAVAQAALAHAQFETIHPFADGNGRTGRGLIHLVLRRRGLATRVLPPVSLILATWAGDYVNGLTATRYPGPATGEAARVGLNQWIGTFAGACVRAAEDAVSFETRVEQIESQWRAQVGPARSGSATDLLLRALPGAPILSASAAAELIGRSFPQANEAIGRLVSAGVLSQISVGKRNRAFEAKDIINAFTDLERQLASPEGDTRTSEPSRPVSPRRPSLSRLLRAVRTAGGDRVLSCRAYPADSCTAAVGAVMVTAVERSTVTGAAGSVHGFPAALTSFVGRSGTVDEIAAQLGEYRLVTVTGPGGAGKTRLAGEVAGQVSGRFADGVWLAELAAVRDPAQVVAAVAAALGIRELPLVGAADALARALARRQLLLVLDNCEHLIDAAAELCGRLLLGADDVRVLATSREPLQIAGESRYRLGPLTLPDPGNPGEPDGSEAVALFADRARRADASFALDEETAPVVARLVTRLDGMPLAIELAAARVEALGVAQLLDRIDDRFALLAAADRLAVARQRSLAATVEWSYRLLDEREQRVFRAVSAFPGPFTLAGAEAVAGAGSGPAVLHLVDCSLLVPPRTGPDGRSRYVMLETLRAYGARLLAEAGEGDAVAAALAGYALRLAEDAMSELAAGTGEVAAGRWLDAEDATVRQALDWTMEHEAAMGHDSAVAPRLAAALAWWWQIRGRLAGQVPLLRAAVDRAATGSDAWCSGHTWLGQASLDSADPSGALRHFTAVRDAIGDRGPFPLLARCLNGRAAALLGMGRIAEAADDARRSLALARDGDHPVAEALALAVLSLVACVGGDRTGAVQLARQAERISAGLRGPAVRVCAHTLTTVLIEVGDAAAAERTCAAGLASARDAGDLWSLGNLLEKRVVLDLGAERYADAASHLREALQTALRTGVRGKVLEDLDCCGYLCAFTGRRTEAVTVWAAVVALGRDGFSSPLHPELPEGWFQRLGSLREARQALGPAQTQAAEERGKAMSLATAAEYVLMLTAADPQPPAAAPGLGALSPRERELVTLVAQGHTDAQIAARLYISVRTVSSHLDRIRDKTGCRRRADLTRLALSAGLV